MNPAASLERHMNHSDRELAFIANTDVLGFIQARNVELKAQAEAEGWQLLMMPCESLADEYANVYAYLHCGAASEYSDWYKELNGIRPRWVRTSEMRLEEIEALVDGLSREADIRQEEDAWRDRLDREHFAAMEKKQAAAQELLSWERTDGILFAIQDRLMGL
jgi:hypothetical protein